MTYAMAVESITMRTVLLLSVEKSKNGGPLILLLSFIFLFWFFKWRMARRCGW